MRSLRSIEKEVSILAPWGRIAGLSWGRPSHPPVLLCHGKLDVSSSFRPLVARLPPDFFYVSLDLPGNGRSDHLPKGIKYSVVDLVTTILKIVQHFKWNKFYYIGHSLGVPIGKIFNMVHPGYISKMVELDPVPAHHTWPINAEGLRDWYHDYYDYYNNDAKYNKFNGSTDTAPKYTYEKARQLMIDIRGLSKESADLVLERSLEPAGEGLYRFTYDQRMKEVPVLPYSGEMLQQLYTSVATPTLCVLARNMVDLGLYREVPFVADPKLWPNGNYRYKIVPGGHDTHIDNPEYMADDISKFLLQTDNMAKL